MSRVNEYAQQSLAQVVGGDRIKTDRVECKMYSSDIGALPVLIAPFVPAGVAGAVVRPRDRGGDRRAHARRARARSGPRAAWRLHFGLRRRPARKKAPWSWTCRAWTRSWRSDKEGLTARVQPGIIWEVLRAPAQREGLDLRLYPSSTPSSTVARLARSGRLGLRQLRVRHVQGERRLALASCCPTETVATYEGDELDRYVADAEGITGIITEVTIRLRPLRGGEVHRARLFRRRRLAGSGAVAHLRAQGSRSGRSRSSTRSRCRSRRRCRTGTGTRTRWRTRHHEPVLPESYLAVIAYPASRRAEVDRRR